MQRSSFGEMAGPKFTALSIAIVGDEPPSEFRIFTAGVVETVKGDFVFDAKAASLVLAEYNAHAIDLMVDYDHASLGVGVDPALSGKAAAWFAIEVRAGELWAVNVRWTPPAAEALRRKEWRFMSPAFTTDDSGRVTSLLNVAITNLPATRRLQPLMAASRAVALGASMLDAETVKKALEALTTGDADACAAILAEMIAAAASGEEAPESAAPAELADDGTPDDEQPEEVMAASARMMRLSGAKTFIDLADKFALFHASHIALEKERQQLAAERGVIEAAERRKGCVDLVTLAGRAPATVWADDKASAPKAYLSSMPIADFREFVADAVRAGRRGAPKPPAASPVEGDLSDREKSKLKKMGVDPAKYLAARTAMIGKG